MALEQYVGVTGITSIEDVIVMTKSLDGYLGMYGVLMKKEVLDGRPRKGRWPSLNDVSTIMSKMPEKSLKTIHWCNELGELNETEVIGAINSTKGQCNAIQLNLVYPSPDFFKTLKEDYKLKTVFQIEDCMFEDPIIMKKKMKPYVGVVDYVIIDQSMGAGIQLDPIVSKAAASEMSSLGFGIVFAGGLTETRVKKISKLIKKYSASVDAEGQLMKNSKDGLDLTKVKNYVEAAVSVMRQ